MNRYIPWAATLICISLVLHSCQKKSALSADFNCNDNNSVAMVEITSDFEDHFSLPVPKNWKTNLYYDTAQSSIYFADTTRQLTEATIIDITFIKKKTSFDSTFLANIQTNYTAEGLIEERNKTFMLKDYPSYYTLAKGIKNNFPYAICNVFINTDGKNLLHAKLEVYGDSLVNQRICKGINLVEKISFK